MKLIEALKEVKDLQKKAEDLRRKVALHSAYLDYETPEYADQKKQVREWIQAHSDILKRIMQLRIAIQKTNLATEVIVNIGGKAVTKTIAEWVHRRRDLSAEDLSMWKCLTDRGLKEGTVKSSSDQPMQVKIVRCYDPAERDAMMDILMTEPSVIDARLEIVNAITDLIE